MKRWFLFACVLSGCGAEEDDVAARAQQCEQLRDHLVDLRLSASRSVGKDREEHREALKAALGDEFVDTCAKSISAGQAACVLGAQDSQVAGECMTADGMGSK